MKRSYIHSREAAETSDAMRDQLVKWDFEDGDDDDDDMAKQFLCLPWGPVNIEYVRQIDLFCIV